MKSALKATMLLGSSTVVSILVGLVSMKLYALWLGTDGLGFLSLLQSAVGLGVLCAGFAINTAQVRFSAEAVRQGERQRASQFRVSSGWVLLANSAIVIVCAFLFDDVIARRLLDSGDLAPVVPLLALSVVFALAEAHQIGVVNAYHLVKALAKNNVITAVLGPTCILIYVLLGGKEWLPFALLTNAIVFWLVAVLTRSRHVPSASPVSSREAIKGARELLAYSKSLFGSQLVSGASIQLLPFFILQFLGESSVGLYKASSVISSRYTQLLSKALGQDYYPRLAQLVSQPQAMREAIEAQHKLLTTLSAPMLSLLMLFSPLIIYLLFSAEFADSLGLLQWLLVADFLRTASWSLAYALMTRHERLYFVCELFFGLCTIAGTCAGLSLYGLEGMGVAITVSYALYYLLLYACLRRVISLTWSRRFAGRFLGTFVLLCGARLLGYVPISWLQPLCLSILSLVLTFIHGRELWDMFRKE